MSLLGRYLYLDECQSVFDPQILTKRTISPVQETEIMRLTAFFLSIGWKKVILKVEEAVNDTLLNVPLGYLTTNEWIKSTILIIRKHVDMNSMILDYLMDDMKEHDVNNIRLSIKSQIDELKDILESSDARDVFHGCLDDAFNVMIESMHPIYFPEATDIIQDESKIIEVQEESKQIVLAGILPKLSRFASQAVSQTPNLYANVKILFSYYASNLFFLNRLFRVTHC